MQFFNKKFFRITFLLSLFISFATAQETRVHGKIFDPLTTEVIPFANIIFKGTNAGGTADINGNYSISTLDKVDSVKISFIGYLPTTLKIKRGVNQQLDIALRANKFDLPEVHVVAGENPADILMRKVIAARDKNSRSGLDAYQYESYNKLEFDINNITEKFANRKIFKPFKFVFNNVDTNPTNNKPFLPVFMAETVSDVYYRKSPENKREIIRANKISGTENETVTQYLGDFYSNINVYNNFIYLFGKGFVSPVAGIAPAYYKYYLTDSTTIDNHWCYKIVFRPRRKQELTFTGDMWIADTAFAIAKLKMRIANDANINFIEDIVFVDDFDFVNDKQWMLTKEVLVINIAGDETKTTQKMGFIGRKTTFFRNFILNQPKDDAFYRSTTDVEVLDDAREHTTAYWDSLRAESLSKNEHAVYQMIDTIKTLPAYKRWVDIIRVASTGYLPVGKISFGPVYSLYSFNSIEGNRFRFGAKTNNNFSTDLILDGYGAYGFKDKQWKYSGNFRYFFSKKPRMYIGGGYKNDVEILGKSPTAFSEDNFFTSIFRRTATDKLTQTGSVKIYIEREWINGFTNRITFTRNIYSPLGNLNFTYFKNKEHTDSTNTLNTSEVTFYLRFAYKERFVTGKVDRVSLGSIYPIVQIQYVRGVKGIEGSNFDYDKIKVKMSDKLYFGSFGKLLYTFEAGKTFGTVPYPLLTVHPGNQSYAFDPVAYNMMNYYEFVSDEYVTLFAEHHFGGLFLDHIPLLRKLKWREVANANILYGRISDSNRNILSDPNAFSTLEKIPYAEVGLAVENIFKFIRVDGVWRVTYLHRPNVSQFGIRFYATLAF